MPLPISSFINKDLIISDLYQDVECYFDYKHSSLVLDFEKCIQQIYMISSSHMDNIESKYNIVIKHIYLINSSISSLFIKHTSNLYKLHIINCDISHMVTNYDYVNIHDSFIRTINSSSRGMFRLSVNDSKIVNLFLFCDSLSVSTKDSYIETLDVPNIISISRLDIFVKKVNIKNIHAYISKQSVKHINLSSVESSYNIPNTKHKSRISDYPRSYNYLSKVVIEYMMGEII